MSSSLLLRNSTVAYLDPYHSFVPSVHSKRCTPILPLKPTTIQSKSSLSSSPLNFKCFPGSSNLLSRCSYTPNRRCNSKLLARSSEEEENTGPYDHRLPVSRQMDISTEPDEEIDKVRQVSRPTELSAGSNEKLDRIEGFLDACWRLSRPFVIKRTIITLIAMAARVWIPNAHIIKWNTLPLKALAAVIAAWCGNIVIDGINQIYDVDIDMINKPNLPIAAGDISLKSAWGLVTFAAVGGLLLVLMTEAPPLVTLLYFLTLLTGYLYSAPPFRMKRFPFTAFLVMITLPCLLNVGVYTSCRAALGLAFEWSPALIYTTIMGVIYGTAFAVVKDLPDVEGDSKFGIDTLATRFGARNIAFLGTGLLLLSYATAILTSVFIPQAGFRLGVFIPANIIMALSLVYKARVLAKANYTKVASYKFFMFLWDLKYVELALLPFI